MEWAKKKQVEFSIADKKSEVICSVPHGFGIQTYHHLNSKYYEYVRQFPTVHINSTRIGLFGEEDLTGMVRLDVSLKDSSDIYRTGTVLDARMGTTSKDSLCQTCFQTRLTCQGHYGYIKLNVHFIHPSYSSTMNKLLRSLCHSCGDLLIGNDSKRLEMLKSFESKLEYADKEGSKGRQCKSCGHINLIVVNPPYTIDYSNVKDLLGFLRPRFKKNKDDTPKLMTIVEIERIIGRITKGATNALYGSNHIGNPKSMIVKFIVVSPLLTRPASADVIDDSQLTEMYDLIMSTNKDIFGGPDVLTSGMSDMDISTANYLYKLYMKLIDKDVVFVRTLSLFRNLKTQLSKKAGIIRNNGIGKRINYSSRTVLSPAAEANLGEISYPSMASKVMTVPEHVTGYNIDKIRNEWTTSFRYSKKRIFSVVIKQPGHQLYGQTIVWKPDIEYKPHIGDSINRTIRTGDMVVFDRQPTLDQYSLLGSQVILPSRNLRVNGLNSCHTKPANADFDGDEGNVNVLQSIGSQCEARILTNIRSSIISSATSSPIVSIQYHGIIGLYKLTLDNVLLDEEDWNIGFSKFWSNNEAFIPIYLHGQEERSQMINNPKLLSDKLKASSIHIHSGQALLSSLLPPTLNYEKGDVKIKDGIMLSGPLTKKDVGGSDKGLIAVLHHTYGPEITANFLSSAQKLADWYLELDPVSIGLKHINPINQENRRIESLLEDDNVIDASLPALVKEDYVKAVWDAPNSPHPEINKWVAENPGKVGTLKPFAHSVNYFVSSSAADIQRQVDKLHFREDMSEYELAERESLILSIASLTNKMGRDIAKEVLGDDNPVVQLQKSGAKGSEGNIAQITASIGQTSMYGKRPEYQMGKTLEFPEGTKTLAFFRAKDSGGFKETIQSRGYVNASYVRGTSPSQFIFSMSQERIGVITSRVSTATSGFFARQIMKFLEEKHVGVGGDMMDTSGRYISFGSFDGLDGTKVSRVSTMKHGEFYSPFDPKHIISRLVGKRAI